MSKISGRSSFAEEMLSSIRDLNVKSSKEGSEKKASNSTEKPSSKTFFDHIKDGIEEVNNVQKASEKKTTDLVTGKSKNIHETMITSAYAGLSFNMLVQVRNKALEAYQEVMRMPV